MSYFVNEYFKNSLCLYISSSLIVSIRLFGANHFRQGLVFSSTYQTRKTI